MSPTLHPCDHRLLQRQREAQVPLPGPICRLLTHALPERGWLLRNLEGVHGGRDIQTSSVIRRDVRRVSQKI